MTKLALSSVFNRPCRFKLKSGKDIYGVVWKDNNDLLFSSLEGYRMILNSESHHLQSALTTIIHEEDILAAEVIPALAS